eukprot:3960574-Pleurochrysis_carterae.AAC.8
MAIPSGHAARSQRLGPGRMRSCSLLPRGSLDIHGGSCEACEVAGCDKRAGRCAELLECNRREGRERLF